MSSKTNNDSKRMSSIAHRINNSFTGRYIGQLFKLDILILLVGLFMWCYGAEKGATGEFHFYTERTIERLDDKEQGFFLKYTIVDEEKQEYIITVTSKELKRAAVAALIVVVVEFFSVLLVSINMKNTIHDKLAPIREMARTTERITDMAYDEHYFKTLEEAINGVNAASPDARITTSDKELQGIENALNNLLDRMRESYRQQTRFVSDASHELRTPIAVIRGYADMLDRWGKEDEAVLEESIGAIKNESAHMQKLVEQLLFLARGDSGRNNLQIEEFSLNELMKEVYEESGMIDKDHNYVFEGGEARMSGDISMIKQCARILIDNAAKYTASGDTITICTGVNEQGSFFSVQDNGIGMKEADVEHIFERFYRSDEARNRKSGGTGLGLSIAKWIVDRHNGYFNILTRSDIGTRITVIFKTNQKGSGTDYEL